MHLRWLLWTACLMASLQSGAAYERLPRNAVGMSARYEGLLTGSELVAAPLDDRDAPLVLRILETYPRDNAYWYVMEYYGLAPGQYDLRDFLLRKDGGALDDVRSLPVEIYSQLPPGQIVPHELPPGPLPRTLRYRHLLIGGAIVWLLGLAALALGRRRGRTVGDAEGPAPVSLAEQLRPLVQQAVSGKLPPERLALLERLLWTYWQRRLGLSTTDAVSSMAALRQHPQAGILLRDVERWLHSPAGSDGVDIERLLAPYQDVRDKLASSEPQRQVATPQSAEALR